MISVMVLNIQLQQSVVHYRHVNIVIVGTGNV
jgi:hypothetical protein